VLPSGSPDDVRREVDRCVVAARQGCALVLAPSSSIGPEVPPANIRAMYEHACR
jgi:uroporphyrinogen-III decarboxylase